MSTPRPARDVAKAIGPLAKPEALEARALAHCAEAVRPPPRLLPDAPADALRALLARRRPLVTRRPAAQHRLGTAPPRLQADLQAPITWLHTRLTALDDDLDTTLRASLVWRERAALLRRVPGMGPVCARTLRLDLPALGTLSRQRLTMLYAMVQHQTPWQPQEEVSTASDTRVLDTQDSCSALPLLWS